MRVSVINTAGIKLASGEWDGRKLNGKYAKVCGQLYRLAYVYDAAHEEEVITTLSKQWTILREATKEQMRVLMEVGNKYRARSA